MAPDPDYITVIPGVQRHTFNVVVMRWNGQVQEHMVFRTSPDLTSREIAESLAKTWGASMKLEVK